VSRRALAWLLGGLAAAAVALQLALPLVGERVLRHRLSRLGRVEHVDVRAWPAVKLLWGRADRVEVRLASSSAGAERLADLLTRTRGARRLDVRSEVLRLGPLVLRRAQLRKRGAGLAGEASVAESDLRAALPLGFDLRPVDAGAEGLVFQGTVRLFDAPVSARIVVLARGGRLVLAPALPLGGLLTLTVFDDPRVFVESVGARPRPGGFSVTARARLRD
jgi:hypothetical protein